MIALALNLWVRSGLIAGIGLLVCRFCRRWPAQQRHHVLLFTFALLAIEPLLFVSLPQLAWSFGHVHAAVEAASVSATAGPVARSRNQGESLLYWPLWVYLAGLSLGLVRLWRSWRWAMIARSRCNPAGAGWQQLADAIAGEQSVKPVPEIRVCADEVMPFACGLRSAAIVLPPACHTWPEFRKRSVLLHELGHVKRHDITTQLAASIVAALWWFQPLCWLLYRKLRSESEAACDAFVLNAGVKSSDYAADLLAVAKQCIRPLPAAAIAIGMVRERGLAGRVAALLQPRQARRVARPLVVAMALSFTALAIGVSAVTVETQLSSPEGGLHMKRAMIAGVLASAGVAGAANISGTTYDNHGVILPNTEVMISNPDNSFTQEMTTDGRGRFAFSSLPPGEYIVRVQRPGFATLFREFHVDSATEIERGLTLEATVDQKGALAAVAAGTRIATPEADNPQQLRVAGTLEQSKLTHKVQPHYPVSAKAAGVQGVVQLEAAISKDGIPQDVRVMSSPNDELSESALEAVRQWRYEPTLLNGQPVGVVTEIIVNYTLAP